MISIDKLSYISKLKNVNPLEKFLFAIITLFLGLFLNNIVVSLIIFFIMSLITIGKAKVPAKAYCKLILIPLVFLLIGIITIAINIGENKEFLFSFNFLNIKMGCTEESVRTSMQILFKSLASVSCLYFLALTTPIVDLLSVLKTLKVPKLFIELMGLIYRFIFILFETVDVIYTSQKSRLGYSTIKGSYNSLAKLIRALFIRSYKRSQDMYTALEARCYTGEINVIEIPYKVSIKNIFIILAVEVSLIIISVIY